VDAKAQMGFGQDWFDFPPLPQAPKTPAKGQTTNAKVWSTYLNVFCITLLILCTILVIFFLGICLCFLLSAQNFPAFVMTQRPEEQRRKNFFRWSSVNLQNCFLISFLANKLKE